MRKYIYIFIISLIISLSFASCEVYSQATTMDDIYYEAQADMVRSDVDFNIVIRYGTPYYYEGSLLYYFYDGLYYYPFYYDNYWYVRVYRYPFTYLGYRPYFRPHRYDYRFEPGHHRGFDRPPVRPNGNRFGQGNNHHYQRPGAGTEHRRPNGNGQPHMNGNGGNHQPHPNGNRGGFGNSNSNRPQSQTRPSTPSRSVTPRSSSSVPRMSSPSPSNGSRSSRGNSERFGGRR